jgi:hypothetical protein
MSQSGLPKASGESKALAQWPGFRGLGRFGMSSQRLDFAGWPDPPVGRNLPASGSRKARF